MSFKFTEIEDLDKCKLDKDIPSWKSIYSVKGFLTACQLRDKAAVYSLKTLGIYSGMGGGFQLETAFIVKKKNAKALANAYIAQYESPIEVNIK